MAAKKIIWPISPIENTPTGDENLKHFFKAFSEANEITVQPVYVLSSEYLVTSDYFEPIDVTALAKNLKEECVSYLKNFEFDFMAEPEVLENQYSSQAAEVNLFDEYVKKNKADFVVMSSHGRSGWGRAFLGSFTENFLLQTETPVIVIGPECKEIKSCTKAIMPVQLNDLSKNFIEKFLDDHRLSFVTQLTLFHKISMLDFEEIAWAPSFYGLGEFSGAELVDKAKETTVKFLDAFKDHPLGQKRLDTLVSEKLETVPNVIEEETKKGGYDMVVMKTESGTFEANILGSVTREVIRQSSKPVVVYPHLFRKG